MHPSGWPWYWSLSSWVCFESTTAGGSGLGTAHKRLADDHNPTPKTLLPHARLQTDAWTHTNCSKDCVESVKPRQNGACVCLLRPGGLIRVETHLQSGCVERFCVWLFMKMTKSCSCLAVKSNKMLSSEQNPPSDSFVLYTKVQIAILSLVNPYRFKDSYLWCLITPSQRCHSFDKNITVDSCAQYILAAIWP